MYQTNVESLNTSELQGEEAEQADESAGEPNDVTDDNPSWGWAAGAAISTVNDLIIWAKADATGVLLSPEAQKERLSWVSPPPSPEVQYGLAIAEFPGGFIGHDGQLPGFNSFVGYNPETGATIVVVTNVYSAPDGSQPANEITRTIVQELSLALAVRRQQDRALKNPRRASSIDGARVLTVDEGRQGKHCGACE
jgi:D-alanyl-D-alanine carboxypeptidase